QSAPAPWDVGRVAGGGCRLHRRPRGSTETDSAGAHPDPGRRRATRGKGAGAAAETGADEGRSRSAHASSAAAADPHSFAAVEYSAAADQRGAAKHAKSR